MTRRLSFAALGSVFVAAILAQNPPPPQQPSNEPQAQQVPDESTLPEEDESVAPEKFVLNPLESERNVHVGNYYWHKGKYRAALRRYEWATKYNPRSAEAFYKVAEAEDKLKNKNAEQLALKKVIELAPDSKFAREAKKKLNKT